MKDGHLPHSSMANNKSYVVKKSLIVWIVDVHRLSNINDWILETEYPRLRLKMKLQKKTPIFMTIEIKDSIQFESGSWWTKRSGSHHYITVYTGFRNLRKNICSSYPLHLSWFWISPSVLILGLTLNPIFNWEALKFQIGLADWQAVLPTALIKSAFVQLKY